MRLLLTGGGSGGPTTPLLALHESLKQTDVNLQTLFLGSTSGPESLMAEKANVPFEAIPSGKLRRYWSWQNFTDLAHILKSFFIAFQKLRDFEPDVIVSAGSFVSVPVAYAAKCLGVPHVLLQMDVKPGLANRLMAPVSQAIAYHFPESASAFSSIPIHKHIGPVLRSTFEGVSIEYANQKFGLVSDKPVLLITGGGQGSLALNQVVNALLPLWLESFQVVHLTGSQHPPASCDHPDYHPFPFVSEGMAHLLARADLVISRAGVGMIGELASLGKDTILVPMPNSHQVLNAQVLEKQGAIVLCPQSTLLQEGESWWNAFMKTYEPGVLGQKLQQCFPQEGNLAFMQLVKDVKKS